MPTFLDNLVDRASRLHTQESIAYLLGRGAALEQIEALGVGFFPDPVMFIPTDDDQKRFAKMFWGGRKLGGKLIFPLRNPMGSVTSILARSIEPGSKDYMRFTLARGKIEGVFFGLDQAFDTVWRDGTITVCEGVFDYFPLARVFPDAVCVLSAVWSKAQMRFLKRYCKSLCVAFDMDGPGRMATKKLIDFYSRDFDVRQLTYPGKDPGDLWWEIGEDRFRTFFNNEKNWMFT